MLIALILTTLAGLATVFGGFIGVHKSMERPGRLSVMLAFAAGAMLCVSFLDLAPAASDSLSTSFGTTAGALATMQVRDAGLSYTSTEQPSQSSCSQRQ